jgi:hypothetical protein
MADPSLRGNSFVQKFSNPTLFFLISVTQLPTKMKPYQIFIPGFLGFQVGNLAIDWDQQ